MMRKILFLSLMAIGLTACRAKDINLSVEAPQKILEDLPGNYTFKTVVDDSVRYSTAVVNLMETGEYQITRITVYGPVLYTFKLGEHATVSSAQLGNGAVTYQPGLKKTTIRFEEKGGSLCELSK